MFFDNDILIGMNENPQYLKLNMANRHGLIAGATGTGKTITLKVLAESFSDAGVPVFTADIKGDLTGMFEAGVDSEDMQARIKRFGLADKNFNYHAYPTCFWDVFGRQGHPVRATISQMGPILLSNIMELTEAQEGVLNIAFQVADDNEMLLLDLKDLRSMLQYISEHSKELSAEYGNITKQSVGAVLRSLLTLEGEEADLFFGEPALDLNDWLRIDENGRGYINVLECSELFLKPRLYATFLLWMLTELYEMLPEVGDLDKPKAVFFFDEAHLLFDNAPKALLEKVEQIVRLIRSKGVGIYFITQSPSDVPDSILAQLGNRLQHALRAYTPAEQKKIKAAADSFRVNPNFKTEDVITELGTGEALLSFIDKKGIPSVVERAFILPPQSKMGPISKDLLAQVITNGEFASKYNAVVDRESAFEMLEEKHEEELEELEREKQEKEEEKERLKEEKERAKEEAKAARQRKSMINSVSRTALNTVSREVTRSFVRNIMGIFKR